MARHDLFSAAEIDAMCREAGKRVVRDQRSIVMRSSQAMDSGGMDMVHTLEFRWIYLPVLERWLFTADEDVDPRYIRPPMAFLEVA